jgi:SAM-dependent MidA family methyltransferase
VSPVFGEVIARALDTWWRELGEPDPFVVAEVGAGSGKLARDVVAASPACAPALRYLLIESSPEWREMHASHLPLEPVSMVLGPAVVGEDDDAEAQSQPGVGPLFASAGELPAERFVGVVLANELLDNMPFGLLEMTPEGWAEVRVGERDGRLVEQLVACEHDGDAPVGARVPVQRAARQWVEEAMAQLRGGRIVAIDYCDTTDSLASRPWKEWVRTYRGHARGGHPLDRPGEQDITCEVAVDQLPLPTVDRSQADFLRAHGLDELVAEYRRASATGVSLEQLTARSRVSEGSALTDPAGLGAFRVMEWVVP